MATGQAAGAAAAMAVRQNISPAEISIDDLRQHLYDRGAVVPGINAAGR